MGFPLISLGDYEIHLEHIEVPQVPDVLPKAGRSTQQHNNPHTGDILHFLVFLVTKCLWYLLAAPWNGEQIVSKSLRSYFGMKKEANIQQSGMFVSFNFSFFFSPYLVKDILTHLRVSLSFQLQGNFRTFFFFNCSLWEFFRRRLVTKDLNPRRISFPWQYITAFVTAIIFKTYVYLPLSLPASTQSGADMMALLLYPICLITP